MMIQVMLLIPYLESSGKGRCTEFMLGFGSQWVCGPRLGGRKKAGTTQLTFLTPLESPGLGALICDSPAC